MFITIKAKQPVKMPPTWALLERQLFNAIKDAAPAVLRKYTRPDVANYDPEHKIIQCARNGSKGPAFWTFTGSPYWPWPGYNLPFYDVPGCTDHESVSADPELPKRLGKAMQERQGKGDSVINLAATSLIANAYLLTGEEKYRAWVQEYVEAWMMRTKENNGVVPDNVGLSGKVGEYIRGKWYGGNYGWTWPHGWMLASPPAPARKSLFRSSGKNGPSTSHSLTYSPSTGWEGT